MLGRKREEESRKAQVLQAAAAGVAFNSAPTTSIATNSGDVLTVSEFISRFDEAAKKRLNALNEKLSELEIQMEALEAQIAKANDNA